MTKEIPVLLAVVLIQECKKKYNKIICSTDIRSEARFAGYEYGKKWLPYFSKNNCLPLFSEDIEFITEVMLNRDIEIQFPPPPYFVKPENMRLRVFQWERVKPEIFDMFVRGYAEGFMKKINKV